MTARREASKRRDVPLRGDRLREEIRRIQERMKVIDRLILEAVRSHTSD